ncbi:hypothetical protein J7J62_02280 [bacterium]|nr:hypothetical protein [bacterium]
MESENKTRRFEIVCHETISNYKIDILKDKRTDRKFLIIKDLELKQMAMCPLHNPNLEKVYYG